MTEKADKKTLYQKAQKKFTEKLKQQGITKTTLRIEDEGLKKIRKLAEAHGVTQNALIGNMLAGQVKALTEVEQVAELLPPDKAALLRHKARHLISNGLSIVPLLEQLVTENQAGAT